MNRVSEATAQLMQAKEEAMAAQEAVQSPLQTLIAEGIKQVEHEAAEIIERASFFSSWIELRLS